MKEEILKQSAKFTGKIFCHTSRSVVGHLLGTCDCNVPWESHFNVIIRRQGLSLESHKKQQEVPCIPGPAMVRSQQSIDALAKGYWEWDMGRDPDTACIELHRLLSITRQQKQYRDTS